MNCYYLVVVVDLSSSAKRPFFTRAGYYFFDVFDPFSAKDYYTFNCALDCAFDCAFDWVFDCVIDYVIAIDVRDGFTYLAIGVLDILRVLTRLV